ncbi:hypothetical protein AAMO2058_000073100 [Amorphochlora amoebiformis]
MVDTAAKNGRRIPEKSSNCKAYRLGGILSVMLLFCSMLALEGIGKIVLAVKNNFVMIPEDVQLRYKHVKLSVQFVNATNASSSGSSNGFEEPSHGTRPGGPNRIPLPAHQNHGRNNLSINSPEHSANVVAMKSPEHSANVVAMKSPEHSANVAAMKSPEHSEKILPPVMWFAPFLSGGGYCSEATTFAIGLSKTTKVEIWQHGDTIEDSYVDGLDKRIRVSLESMLHSNLRPDQSAVVCHSGPWAWYPPEFETTRCPPVGSKYTIGRTMFETDTLPDTWADRINALDETWVPTEFHARIFAKAGVSREKLVVIGESVDTDFYNPEASLSCKHFANVPKRLSRPGEPLENIPGNWSNSKLGLSRNVSEFRFLSVFKWEDRKGWDILLKGYMNEFDASDPVILYILTNAYHTSDDFDDKIRNYLYTLPSLAGRFNRTSTHKEASKSPKSTQSFRPLPKLELLQVGVPLVNMPCMYREMDALVLPSRGEGWGRPHVEAMSMGLPIIATNWSGPTEFMTEENSYPLKIDGLEQLKKGPYKGHKWAAPSVSHLQQLMRHLVDNPTEARHKGKRARKDMVDKYCISCINRVVTDRLAVVYDIMQNSTASRRGRSRSRQSQSRQSQASVSTKPRPIGTNFTINLPDGSRPTPWPLSAT